VIVVLVYIALRLLKKIQVLRANKLMAAHASNASHREGSVGKTQSSQMTTINKMLDPTSITFSINFAAIANGCVASYRLL
jgi:hypothetical protein